MQLKKFVELSGQSTIIITFVSSYIIINIILSLIKA